MTSFPAPSTLSEVFPTSGPRSSGSSIHANSSRIGGRADTGSVSYARKSPASHETDTRFRRPDPSGLRHSLERAGLVRRNRAIPDLIDRGAT